MKRTPSSEIPDPVEIELPHSIRIGAEPDAKGYRMGECFVMVGKESAGWHLSISCADRYPTWDEVAHARYKLIPNSATMAMILPPREEYVNVHDYCLHIWQIDHGDRKPVYDASGRVIGIERV